jgi:regulator of protease activity HflC (stomatin/prohibitin superfamily)
MENPEISTYIRKAGLGVSALLLLIFMAGTWFTVDATERAVVLRMGALSHVAKPGLGFKLPMIDTVEKVSMQTNTFHLKMNSYSSDQQAADMDVSVTLHVSPEHVGSLYERYQSLESLVKRVIEPVVKQQAKIIFGRYTAVKAIQERAVLNNDVLNAITAALKNESAIVLESIQLEDIKFSGAYEDSVEQRMLAEVEVLKLKQNAEREKVQAQIKITQAQADAQAVRESAEAEADSIRVKGEAEADAIKARGAALRDNPNLIGLVQAERWNGELPSTMVPGAAIPMINIAPKLKPEQ